MRVEGDEHAGPFLPVHGKQLRVFKSFEDQVQLVRLYWPVISLEAEPACFDGEERLGQFRDGRRFQERGKAIGAGGPVEQTEQFQEGQHARAARPVTSGGGEGVLFQPAPICLHDAEGVAPLLLGVGFFELHEIALADVPAVSVAQISAEEVQGEGVAFHVLHELFELLRRAVHAERAEQGHASFGG